MTTTRLATALASVALCCTTWSLEAQVAGRDVNTERRTRAGVFLEPGWHPYGAVGPAMPMGRLGELTTLGVSAELGAWLIDPDRAWPGFGVELVYASHAADTDEMFTGRYQIAGAQARLTSKGKQRLLFDWLGGYGSIGAGVFRHGATSAGMRTTIGASGSLGMLVPLAGREGFIETRVQHLFSGETLGRGNGITYAPLLFGVRF
jgi:hypothetical protein